MPTYEYICDACHFSFEKVASVKDRDDMRCSHCHARARRIISAGIPIKKRENSCNGCGESNCCPKGMCGPSL